jgi:hypothetical protein
MALFSLALLTILTRRLHKCGAAHGSRDKVDLGAACVLAILPVVMTNTLVLVVGGSALALHLYLLLLRGAAPGVPLSLRIIQPLTVEFVIAFLKRIGEVFYRATRLQRYHISRRVSLGVLGSLVPLLVFHILFATVNQSYKDNIHAIVRFILDLDAFLWIGEIAIQSLVIHALLTVQLPLDRFSFAERERDVAVTISLLPIVLLFGIFSLFQTSAVAHAMSIQTFQELSLYVQRGFWELLVVGCLGYQFWLLVHRRGKDLSTAFSVQQILSCFAGLLLLISLFTAHKVGLLQASFGFKDQRVYASLATALLGMGFILSLLHLRGRISTQAILRSSVTSFLLGSACLGVVNIDYVASLYNPVRFYVDEAPRRDLSYLLGNSFDNISAWEDLMQEGISVGIPTPRDYYWGRYLPLCRTSRSSGAPTMYLLERHRALIQKYSAPIDSFRQIGRFHPREYAAYRWLLSHDELRQKFNLAVEESCKGGFNEEGRYYSAVILERKVV